MLRIVLQDDALKNVNQTEDHLGYDESYRRSLLNVLKMAANGQSHIWGNQGCLTTPIEGGLAHIAIAVRGNGELVIEITPQESTTHTVNITGQTSFCPELPRKELI